MMEERRTTGKFRKQFVVRGASSVTHYTQRSNEATRNRALFEVRTYGQTWSIESIALQRKPHVCRLLKTDSIRCCINRQTFQDDSQLLS
jgi:hypothetical protein